MSLFLICIFVSMAAVIWFPGRRIFGLLLSTSRRSVILVIIRAVYFVIGSKVISHQLLQRAFLLRIKSGKPGTT